MPFIKELVMHGFKSFARETKIPFKPSMNVIVGPNGSGKCLTKDSLVQLGDGTMQKIGYIVNSRINNAIATEDGFLINGDGTEVMCLDFDTLKTTKKQIKAFIKRKSPEKLLKIKTRSGREITSTKYHPFFGFKNSEVVALKAEELKQGIRIAVPRKITFKPEHNCFTELLDEIAEKDRIYVPYHEEYVLALKSIKKNLTWRQLAENIGISFYVLKGLLDKQSINFYSLVRILRAAGLSDIEISEVIPEVISNGKRTLFSFKNSEDFARFFGYLLAEGRLAESSQIWFTNGTPEVVKDYICLARKLFGKEPLVREYKPNSWDVIIFSEPLKKILGRLGMASKTESKKISNILLKHSSDKEISQLLNGLYCGDGYISNNSIEITTKSDELAEGIKACLLRLGMVCLDRETEKRINETGFVGDYRNLILYGVDNFIKFNRNIQLIHRGKRSRILAGLNKKSNPNLDLLEANNLVNQITKELAINVKLTKRDYPVLDAYCYNQCLPSINGLRLLSKQLFDVETVNVNKLNLLIYSDIYWDEIIQITEIKGEEWVYDLCVEKDHNFIANNIFAHNSNITDAICFVLGRLGSKSMRAKKLSNLVFAGTQKYKPASEASVELIFDNADKGFSIDEKAVSIKRILRKGGQGIYKINNEVRTRQEVLELLSQAGIDPDGFNIILQGEIDSFVKMPPDQRREVIEEVAGISIYEIRKQRSLRELEKTEMKLKEVSATLRERTAYLKNLEQERRQALRYQKFQQDIKNCKASILHKTAAEKQAKINAISTQIKKHQNETDNINSLIDRNSQQISVLNSKIANITNNIQKQSGIEQERLNNEISDLRADIAGLDTRKQSLESQISETKKRKSNIEENIRGLEQEIAEMSGLKSGNRKKSLREELGKKKKQLDEIDRQRRRLYQLKSNLSSFEPRIDDKKIQIQRIKNESDFTLSQIQELELQLKKKESLEQHQENLAKLKQELENLKKNLDSSQQKKQAGEKLISAIELQISETEKIRKNISSYDICPICKTKMTKEHVSRVVNEINEQQSKYNSEIKKTAEQIKETEKRIIKLNENIISAEEEVAARNHDILQLGIINEKKQALRKMSEQQKQLEKEFSELESKKSVLEKQIISVKTSEGDYDSILLEIQELERREEKNVGMEITLKQRDVERARLNIHEAERSIEEDESELGEVSEKLEEKQDALHEKTEQDEALKRKFRKTFDEKAEYQEKIRFFELDNLHKQTSKQQIADKISTLRIQIAELDAQKNVAEQEQASPELANAQIIRLSVEELKIRLDAAQRTLGSLGTVNMRSLEVYEGVKAEYDKVQEKVSILQKEKEEIFKIIEDVDKKKRKVFLKTLSEINVLFSRNFSQLSTKGIATLEPTNPENLFEEGLEMLIKIGKGKYFDTHSLSGGEKSLISLSLIFAIQEYKPYCFYIFDEIDAALDKRNSERLAALLKKYMKNGQYLIITHNDSLITEAPTIYGVVMQDKISSVFSMEV